MGKKKGLKIGVGVILAAILIGLVGTKMLLPYFIPVKIVETWGSGPPTSREEILYNFIENNMITQNGGIKTNYLNEQNEGDITKGDSVLSESEGLMLLYYIERNDEAGFEKTFEYIKNNMLLDNGLISWRIDGDKKSQVTATIDELRIIKALIIGGEKWNSIKYRYYAITIANSLYKNLREENLLVDFNDGKTNSDMVTLCYIDLSALKYLTNIDFKWKSIYTESEKILNGGFISDKVPLYRKDYNIKTRKYDNNENVEMNLNTIILLNKAEVGDNISKSVDWIVQKFKDDGAIYSLYNAETGAPATDIQSTTIYANLLQIAEIENNEELYKMALRKLNAYQVVDKDSVLYGGYGDKKTLEVYSFDNLNALLAYRDVK
ncbi:glycosyl hydrolase family 8 [uncultured Clostridium sp.]|uniref:glycosyl hydrolase family 8 n=1 Tax=uncultured Clostridium sp. TaxID=59620 RepID=UPI002614A3B4|nr:glycosyl hydrolase family 8 [uncultured Clostridium sp.]